MKSVQKRPQSFPRSLTIQKQKKVPLSLGLITGFKILSNYGPKINVRLVPAGAASADYETELTNSGINGVNYKVYINIKASVKIISPLCNKSLEITRKYMLADITFTGTVPNAYLNLPGLYKTE